MNLEKGYRPAGDFIIEDADYQSAGIPSLCIEVCPTFYRDWTIPELVMPMHDMSRFVTALIMTASLRRRRDRLVMRLRWRTRTGRIPTAARAGNAVRYGAQAGVRDRG
jgi:hypothetical protein